MSTTTPSPTSGNPMRAWLANRKVNTKLMILLGVLLLVAFSVGTVAVGQIRSLSGKSQTIYQEGAIPLKNLAEARVALGGMRQRVLLHLAGPVDDKPRREKQISELDAKFDAKIEEFGPSFRDKALLEDYLQAVEEYREFRDGTIVPASRAGKQDTGAILAECDRLFAVVVGLGDRLGEEQVAAVDETAQAAAAAARHGTRLVVGFLVIGTLVSVALAVIVGRMIVGSLTRVKTVLAAVAAGDLTQSAAVGSQDEVGQMAQELDTALGNVRGTITSVDSNASSLAAAAEQLAQVAQQMAASAEESSVQANVVAAAADEVSRNVQTVAAGGEEMGASIREISSNAAEAARVAGQAVTVAQTTNDTVSKLGDSSAQIGEVVKVITSIAEQTNLLALNATIEAARAGEAGKGFAVVANEVKDLAQETSKATEEISQKIAAIQADTSGAVAAIAEISSIIGQINDFQTTIASAVEEQSATTSEMNRNVAEASAGSGQIAENITGVAQAAQDTTQGVSEAQRSVDELSRMAGELRALVGQFRY